MKTVLKCEKAGKTVKDLSGNELACRYCNGLITVEDIGGKLKVHLSIGNMFSLPRIPHAMFNCPATLPDPRKSNLVEVVK